MTHISLLMDPRPRVGVMVGLGVAVLALTACQSEPPEPVGVDYYKFSTQPSDEDVPEVSLDEDVLTDLDDHYFRYLGVHGSTDFHMARTAHEDTTAEGLCFIAVDRESDTAETQCADPDELDPKVVHLQRPFDAFLVPDDAEADLPDGWSRLRPNIIAITEPEVAPDQADVYLPGDPAPEAYTLQR